MKIINILLEISDEISYAYITLKFVNIRISYVSIIQYINNMDNIINNII